MKRFLAALMIVCTTSISANSLDLSRETPSPNVSIIVSECITIDQMLKDNKEALDKFGVLDKKESNKLYNTVFAKIGLPQFDSFLVVTLTPAPNKFGIVAFDSSGCVIKETFGLINQERFRDLLKLSDIPFPTMTVYSAENV